MKITSVVECHLNVRASLDEAGDFSVAVVAAAVYDEKTKAYTSVKVTPSRAAVEKIKVALEEALQEQELTPRIAVALQDAISVSRSVGLRLKEIEPNTKEAA